MATLINVTESMVTALTPNAGNVMSLFDGNNTTFWFADWSNYPARIVIDLQTIHQIDNIRVFDGTGAPTLKFQLADTPFVYSHSFSHVMTKYLDWSDITVGKAARYLYLEIIAPEGDKPIGALEIYGITTGSGGGGGGGSTITYGEASKTICTNSFHWVPNDVLSPFSIVREYNYWQWYEGKKGVYEFEPSAETGANLDSHFTSLKAVNIIPLFCIHQSPVWLNTYADFNVDDRPTDTGDAKGDDPLAYSTFAKFMFQVAARYGRQTYPASRLPVAASNTPKSGLNLLDYISPWNEPDKWWRGPRGNIKANEYAALLSAVWDGHEGRIAGDVGIKKADSTMKVVLGGLTDFKMDYITEMNNWFKTNRTDKQFCADVIDVHHYSGNYGTNLFAPYAKGVAPETDDLKNKLKTFVDYSRALLPNREIWLTEFGYDTGTASPQRSTAYGSFSAEEVQAMWNIRSYMEAIAAGVDRSFVFNIYDENNDQTGIFQTSGVLRSRGDNLAKKVAWFKISELATKLKGLTFKGNQSASAAVRNYLFANADNSKRLAVMWSPTENSSVLTNYSFENKVYTVSEMPSLVDVSPSAGGGGGGTGTVKKLTITIDDTNKVGSKTTHEMTITTADEVLVNGVKVTADVQIVIKRATTTAGTAATTATATTTTKTTTTSGSGSPNQNPPTISPTGLPPNGATTKKTTKKKVVV